MIGNLLTMLTALAVFLIATLSLASFRHRPVRIPIRVSSRNRSRVGDEVR